ncbi:ZIP family metal transporter [Candidatus Woesearchaeota archaeon]|nr:ZIP family metal transporter [Candidatus Woesearchaeota archaeon]
MLEAILYTLISVLVVSLISFVGVLTFFFKTKKISHLLLILVSVSAGSLFGGAFLHLLPEIVRKKGFTTTISLLILLGIVLFFILEKIIHWHRCHYTHWHSETEREHIGWLNLIGDGVHNFIDGLVIAGSYLIDTHLGLATTLAVILHEIPQEIADFGVLIFSGFSRFKALFFNFCSAAVAILGAIVGLALGTKSEAYVDLIIPIAAGGFIYIAGSNLIPELHKECQLFKESLRYFLGFIIGMTLMLAITYIKI